MGTMQVYGGSEFCEEFERAHQEPGGCAIRVVLSPRSPKVNGGGKDRTHSEEFHDVYLMIYTVALVRATRSKWEEVYNMVRPHRALGCLTPRQCLAHNGILGKEGFSEVLNKCTRLLGTHLRGTMRPTHAPMPGPSTTSFRRHAAYPHAHAEESGLCWRASAIRLWYRHRLAHHLEAPHEPNTTRLSGSQCRPHPG